MGQDRWMSLARGGDAALRLGTRAIQAAIRAVVALAMPAARPSFRRLAIAESIRFITISIGGR